MSIKLHVFTAGPFTEELWETHGMDEVSLAAPDQDHMFIGNGASRVEAVLAAGANMRAALKDKGLAAALTQQSLDYLSTFDGVPTANETGGMPGLYVWAALVLVGDVVVLPHS